MFRGGMTAARSPELVQLPHEDLGFRRRVGARGTRSCRRGRSAARRTSRRCRCRHPGTAATRGWPPVRRTRGPQACQPPCATCPAPAPPRIPLDQIAHVLRHIPGACTALLIFYGITHILRHIPAPAPPRFMLYQTTHTLRHLPSACTPAIRLYFAFETVRQCELDCYLLFERYMTGPVNFKWISYLIWMYCNTVLSVGISFIPQVAIDQVT